MQHTMISENNNAGLKKRRPPHLVFRDIASFAEFNIFLFSPNLLLGIKKKGARSAKIEIKEIDLQISGLVIANSNTLYIPRNEFYKFPLSAQLKFTLRTKQTGLTEVKMQSASIIHSGDNANGIKQPRKARNHARKKQPTPDIQFNGKVVISDDNILPLCKRTKIRFGDYVCDVTGYISQASGSLLVPASCFTSEVPPAIRSLLNWEDPVGHLRKYEKSNEVNAGKWDSLKAQSLLHRYGYSVKTGVAKEFRQKILFTVVEKNDLSKDEVVRHIRSLIARNKNRYPEACTRWEDDIAYVQRLSEK